MPSGGKNPVAHVMDLSGQVPPALRCAVARQGQRSVALSPAILAVPGDGDAHQGAASRFVRNARSVVTGVLVQRGWRRQAMLQPVSAVYSLASGLGRMIPSTTTLRIRQRDLRSG
jgi:hypothetical protein